MARPEPRNPAHLLRSKCLGFHLPSRATVVEWALGAGAEGLATEGAGT